MLTGDTYSSGHLVPSHLVLAYVLLVETNPYPELVVIFFGLTTANITWYFLEFTLLNSKKAQNMLYIKLSAYDKICEKG